VLPTGHLFRLFDVEDVSVGEGEWKKHKDGIPTMKFGKSNMARKIVLLNITSDF
jgi:hypothetical protein